MISAACTEGDGRTPWGGDTPVLTLRYTAPEVRASAERHILYTFISGMLLTSRVIGVVWSQTDLERPQPESPGPVGLLRPYAGRREMALANVLGSTSRAAPILRAVSGVTGPSFRSSLVRVRREMSAFWENSLALCSCASRLGAG